ncbi:MAG TPA: hypothetical protein VLA04_00695 [Verrucomicrobiae bacterium]|nr:hypothetical protein [Verrucomicrobiae bacterium]
MPVFKCANCGGSTNSTTCDYVAGLRDGRIKHGEAEKCFLRLTPDGKRYEKGCAYDQANSFQRKFADGILARQDET